MADGWRIDGGWMADGWRMDGRWMADGWSMVPAGCVMPEEIPNARFRPHGCPIDI